LSGALLERTAEKIEITEEPISEKLLKASLITATLFNIRPETNLRINKKRLQKIPTTPNKIPYFFLTALSSVLS
jgi:hypothetical protein